LLVARDGSATAIEGIFVARASSYDFTISGWRRYARHDRPLRSKRISLQTLDRLGPRANCPEDRANAVAARDVLLLIDAADGRLRSAKEHGRQTPRRRDAVTPQAP